MAIESSGIPFPGETMLLTASAYAGAGHLRIPFVIGAAAAGAIIGDNLGYLAGRKGGRPLVLRYGKYLRLDEARLDAGQRFFERHGDKTVFLGRFIAILRAWAAFLAGVNRMPWPRFLFFNAAGGITWATVFGTLAFIFGRNLPVLEKVVRAIGIGGIVAVIVVVIILLVLRWRARQIRRGVLPLKRDKPTDSDSSESPISGS